MPWRIDRMNMNKGETQTAPGSYTTAQEAFDVAMDNVGQFIKDSIRRTQNYGDLDGPAGSGTGGEGQRYKVYVDYTGGATPLQLTLRYDYPLQPLPNPGGEWDTNDIHWRLRQE